MNSDDLRRYGREVLIPMVTMLRSSQYSKRSQKDSKNHAAVNRVVEYKYLDESINQRYPLIQQVTKVFLINAYF